MLFKGNLAENVLTGTDKIEWIKILGQSGTSDRPSGLVLQANAAGVMTDYYIWVDQDGNLRMHTSKPTNEDANGSVVTGVSNAGASLALDNITSCAINTTLASDTDSTDDLGTSSIYWANAYLDKIYLSATSTLTGGSSVCTFDGGVTIGADDAGHDLILYGETADQYAQWDMNYNTNAGGFILRDNVMLVFGDSGDITMEWDETDFNIEAAADDSIFMFGGASDIDVHFKSHDNANQDAAWISDIYTFQICNSTILQLGGGAIDTVTDGFQLIFDGTDTLNIDPITANDVVRIGETTVGDFYLDGASYDAHWDGSQNAYVFNDAAELAFGSSLDIYMRYEGSGDTLDIGQTADGTGSVDFIDTPVLLTGADSAGTLLTIAGIDTTGNSDTVTLAHSGTGSGLHITCTTATAQGLEIDAAASQTTWAAIINGAGTPAWIGANDVGMLTLKTDTAGANAGATALLVQHASAQPVSAAEGFLARFVDTGTARTNAYGVGISTTNTTPALHCNNEVVIAGANSAGTLLSITGIDTTGNSDTVTIDHSGEGAALYIDCNEADSVGIEVEAYANATVPIVMIDGDTAGWLGAANKGMVHLQNDITLAETTSSLLLLDNSGTPKAAASGFALKILDSSGATGSTYAMAIASTNNEALHVDSGAVLVDEKITTTGLFHTVYDGKATVAGATTGLIPAGVSFWSGDSDDNAHIVVLPAAVEGQQLVVFNDDAAQDFVLTAAAGDTINGGVAAGAVTIAEDEVVFLFAVNATDWRAFKIAGAGTLATAGQSA